ncbi:hypothetical protein [uncultured Ellagibacter sp.]|uniref:hypothetical protein n=1 Tax=uncultured Ellagibacter sp. TaxID=2137580 RepID=UPI00261E2CF6|nr:hypothetical protein [uncultured Ellagibacter sp.]
MGRFRHHAEKIVDGGQGIMDRYLDALRASQTANEAFKAVERRNYAGSQSRPSYRELAEAQEAREAASKRLSETVRACKAESAKLAREGRRALDKDVESFYSIDSGKFDLAFSALADSGIMEDSDYAAAFGKYAENGTMLRYLAGKVEPRVKAGVASAELRNAYSAYAEGYGPDAVKANFKTLCRTLERFTCSDYSPHWDKQVEPMMEVF